MKGRKPAQRENEIKLAIPAALDGRRLLRQAGFRISKARVLEVNVVFDTPDLRILGAGSLLRLREVRGGGLLTYKGPAAGGTRHKSRQEIESAVENPAAARLILERLGHQAIFQYEKFRTEFARPGEPGIATVDETPIGVFLEIEGPPRWVDRTARTLGFSARDYITLSYWRLYLEYCEARGMAPQNMVFACATKGK